MIFTKPPALSYAWSSRVGIPRRHDLERTNCHNPILQMGRVWIFHRRLIVVTGEVVSRLVYDSTLLESNKPISPKFWIDLTPESSGFPWVESIPLMAQEFSQQWFESNYDSSRNIKLWIDSWFNNELYACSKPDLIDWYSNDLFKTKSISVVSYFIKKSTYDSGIFPWKWIIST